MTETLNRAMRLLAQRDHSETELRRKLAAQDVSEEDVEQAIAYCHEHHWLDDRRFAERYLVMRSQKGYGVQRIQQELGMKGIARELIMMLLRRQISTGVHWRNKLRIVSLVKLSPKNGKKKQRCSDFYCTEASFRKKFTLFSPICRIECTRDFTSQ